MPKPKKRTPKNQSLVLELDVLEFADDDKVDWVVKRGCLRGIMDNACPRNWSITLSVTGRQDGSNEFVTRHYDHFADQKTYLHQLKKVVAQNVHDYIFDDCADLAVSKIICRAMLK